MDTPSKLLSELYSLPLTEIEQRLSALRDVPASAADPVLEYVEAELARRGSNFAIAHDLYSSVIRTDDKKLRVRAMLGLGECIGMRAQFDHARKIFGEAYELADDVGDVTGMGLALCALARLDWHQGDSSSAVERIERSLTLLRSGPEPQFLIVANFQFATQLGTSGDVVGVLKVHSHSLELIEEHRHYSSLPNVHFALGMTHLRLDQTSEAEEHFAKCQQFATIYNHAYVAKALWGLAHAAEQRQDWHAATEIMSKCSTLVESIPNFYVDTLGCLAKYAIALGDAKGALELFDRMSARKDAYTPPRTPAVKAKAHAMLKHWEIAATLYEQALQEAEVRYDPNDRRRLVELEIKLAQQRSEHEAKVAEMRQAHLESLLANMTKQQLEQTERMERIKDQVIDLARDQRHDPLSKKLTKLVKDFPTSMLDWVALEQQFASTYPEFQATLNGRCPDLTEIERRICMLLKTNLTSQQIGSVLHLSPRTVENHRYRIRKKLDLSPSEDIVTFLRQL